MEALIGCSVKVSKAERSLLRFSERFEDVLYGNTLKCLRVMH